jgi:hypothetical protein
LTYEAGVEADTAVLLSPTPVGTLAEVVPPTTLEIVLLPTKLLPPGMMSPTIPPRSGRPVSVEPARLSVLSMLVQI